jgi:8-oxo-dGTP diphosphatase
LLPPLAFDHLKIVTYALERLRAKLQYEPLAFDMLPTEFTLYELQQFYEALLGHKLDKRNFRKKILSFGFLREGKKRRNVSFRSPSLYKFERSKYERMRKRGDSFSI